MCAQRPPQSDDRPDGIGGLIDDLLGSRALGDALSRLVDQGGRVARAQQQAFSALGLPTGTELEGLALRIRTVFQRVDELEDDIDRLTRRVAELERQAKTGKPAGQSPATDKSRKSPVAKPATARSRKSPASKRRAD